MTFVLALLAGILGAVIGNVVVGGLVLILAEPLGLSNFEGEAGFFAVFGAGPIGGLIGLIASIWLVLRRRGGFSAGALAGRMLLVIGAIAVLAAGVLAYLYFERDMLASNSLPPALVFELRLPAGVTVPAKLNDIRIDLNTDKNVMPATIFDPAVRADDGRTILNGSVELYYRTSQRLLVVALPNEPVRLFALKLRASPAFSDEFGAWQRADFIDDKAAAQPRKADANDGFEIRYRVEDRSRVR